MKHSAPPLVLSIQSHVAYGHVGNDAAMLPLQLLGIQPVAVHTVQFSNHTGYGEFKGQVFSAAHIQEVLEGLRARGVLANCRAVLSGYLGNAAIGEVILSAVQEIRHHQPDLVYLCDPVMGDVGRGLFVQPDIPHFLREQALQQATILTPNHFEFELLHGTSITHTDEAIRAARELLGTASQRGPDTIVITSLRTIDLPADQLSTLVVTVDQAWTVHTPFLELNPAPNGMGDVFSAVLLGHLLNGKVIQDAVSLAVSSLYALVTRTSPGQRDLPLISAREQLIAPGQPYTAICVNTD